jgi:hypothetical protein
VNSGKSEKSGDLISEWNSQNGRHPTFEATGQLPQVNVVANKIPKTQLSGLGQSYNIL